MTKRYKLHYLGTKHISRALGKHRYSKVGFDIEVFANSKIEAVKYAKYQIMNSISYNTIDSFTLVDISVIE